MLVLDGEVEHEVGRTETVMDDLSPEWNAYVSLSYSVSAALQPGSKTLLRFEVCDPATAPPGGSPSKAKKGKEDDQFTVIGAEQMLLADVHQMVNDGAGSGVAGLLRQAFTMRQKGELQGLIKRNEKEKETKYGTMLVAIERIATSSECVSFIIGCSKLYTNKLSMRPDPYVRIFRRLEATSSGDDVKGMPERCPVYASNYVRSTREASWSTTAIPMQLLTNNNMESRIIVEIWDFQFNAEDRLIGFVELTARQLLTNEHGDGPKNPAKQTYVKAHMLNPPSLFAQTGSIVDRSASLLTGGVASKPGTFSVFSVKKFKDPETASQHCDCFDVDTVLREKKASKPIEWEPLERRRQKFTAKVRAGIIVMETDCCSRTAKAYRRFKASMATWGCSKGLIKYAPFYQTRKFIGAKHGTAFEAYFAFSYTLIRQNFLIAIIWFVLVVAPQYILMRDPSPDIIHDLVTTFGLRDFAEAAQRAAALAQEAGGVDTSQVDLNALSNILDSGNSTAFRPGVLIFSGYLPRFSLSGLTDVSGMVGGSSFLDGLSASMYHLDFAYVVCVLITMSISLFSVVCALGGQIGAVGETGHAARADGTGQVMEAIFGGWDHLSTTEGGTRQCRYALVTQMKEGMGEAVRAAERKARVKTEWERKKLFAARFVAMTLSFLFVICSVVTVLYVTSPPGALIPDARGFLDELSETVRLPPVTPFHTLIVTLINVFSPVLIKLLVRMEQWDSPETEISQTLIRQICLKLANLIVLYLAQRTGTVYVLQDRTSPSSCYEAEAAKNFMRLILTDMMISGVITYFIKAFLYYPARWGYALCGKREEKEVNGVMMKVLKPIPDSKGVCGPFGKKGPLDLPTEIVNICYRQTMLLVGSLVSPWIFVIGIFSNTVIYATKYLVIANMCKPPDKPFKASSIKKLFYAVLLVSNIVGIFPIAHFLSATNNPNCGPLRPYECAMEAEFGETTYSLTTGPNYQNTSACSALALTRRANYAVFSEVLLPVSISDMNPLDAVIAAAEGNSTQLASLASGSCDAWIVICWASLVITALFSPLVMLMLTLLMCICLFFARKQGRRLVTELDAANEECAQEHFDKVKLLRYAGVSLD